MNFKKLALSFFIQIMIKVFEQLQICDNMIILVEIEKREMQV